MAFIHLVNKLELDVWYFEFYAKWLFVQSSPPVKIWTVSKRKRKISKALGQTRKVRLQIPVVILQGN